MPPRMNKVSTLLARKMIYLTTDKNKEIVDPNYMGQKASQEGKIRNKAGTRNQEFFPDVQDRQALENNQQTSAPIILVPNLKKDSQYPICFKCN